MRARRLFSMPALPMPGDMPLGFSFASAACGIKKNGRPDLALFVSECRASAAGVFTTNVVKAAPVVRSRQNLESSAGHARAIVVNSSNANCCTGSRGRSAALATCMQSALLLGCRPDEVLVASTGVIGVPMPHGRLLRALPGLLSGRRARRHAFAGAARAIMTTDTRPKWAAAQARIGGTDVRLLGCAKGAGMIHPNMATMLAFVLTDAAVEPPLLESALREIAARTFNCISVDGDTSTNDTLIVLANGASGVATLHRRSSPATRRFLEALETVCRSLALQIVADGEGAGRVVEIAVCGAPSEAGALRVARTIATSPLVKTALAGADPNWGRVLAAAGRSGVPFDPAKASITLAGIPVFRRGAPLALDERRAHRAMCARQYSIVVNLGAGKRGASARVWTCDFTADYVMVNSSYRT